MSANDFLLLNNAGSAVTGAARNVSGHSFSALVRVATWGDGSVKLQYAQEDATGETWVDLKDGTFTANDQVIVDAYPGMKVRAVTTGATLAGATVVMGSRL